MSDYMVAYQAKTISKEGLLGRRNVVGVGVGLRQQRRNLTDELSVVVLVRRKLPKAALDVADLVPQEVGGVRTDVIEVGDLRPLAQLTAGGHTARQRPAPAGVSIGHYMVTAGTLGCVVHERTSGERLILSNNHVLANCNNAAAGDPILQPGPADGGELGKDTLAYLHRFAPLRYTNAPATCSVAQTYAQIGNLLAQWSGARHRLQAYQANPTAVNHIDAALARPIQDHDLLDEIYAIGRVEGVAQAALGMAVMKSGRTTGFTHGTITVLDAAVTVNYGPDRAARFEGQIVANPMSQGGDSGSLVVAGEGRRAVGLLFAGSSQATICNPIQWVLDQLKVDLPRLTAKCAEPAVVAAALPTLPKSAAARPDVQRAEAVRRLHAARLLARPNVVGVGVGLRHRGGQRTDDVGLVVLVERKLPRERLLPDEIIPTEIDGVPVDVREVGRVEAADWLHMQQSATSTHADR